MKLAGPMRNVGTSTDLRPVLPHFGRWFFLFRSHMIQAHAVIEVNTSEREKPTGRLSWVIWSLRYLTTKRQHLRCAALPDAGIDEGMMKALKDPYAFVGSDALPILTRKAHLLRSAGGARMAMPDLDM